jgi:hypothetical protein
MVTMFDNVEASTIPADAQACAGYVDGNFADVVPMKAKFPHLDAMGRVVTVSTQGAPARILDVETGNPIPASDAAVWVKRMIAAKVWMPGVYTFKSNMGNVQTALDNAKLVHGKDYVLWIADWTFVAHLPAGFEACQWTDKSGPNDESICLDSFFPSQSPPLAHGLANAALQFNSSTGGWKLHPTSGPFKVGPASQNDWDSLEVQFNKHTGKWRYRSMPLNAKPLGK